MNQKTQYSQNPKENNILIENCFICKIFAQSCYITLLINKVVNRQFLVYIPIKDNNYYQCLHHIQSLFLYIVSQLVLSILQNLQNHQMIEHCHNEHTINFEQQHLCKHLPNLKSQTTYDLMHISQDFLIQLQMHLLVQQQRHNYQCHYDQPSYIQCLDLFKYQAKVYHINYLVSHSSFQLLEQSHFFLYKETYRHQQLILLLQHQSNQQQHSYPHLHKSEILQQQRNQHQHF